MVVKRPSSLGNDTVVGHIYVYMNSETSDQRMPTSSLQSTADESCWAYDKKGGVQRLRK